MKSIFNIDKTDVKILQALIRDARSKRKDIANECGLSSTAIKNRIDRMKKSGLIIKPVLTFNMAFFEYEIPLFIGVNLDPDREHDIIKFIKRQVIVAGINKTIGKYDLCLIVFAKSINELDELKYLIRKQKGVKNVELNIFSKKHFNFDNIDFI
ncbi:MAG TPA: Lrp/AsnC family transcriptional regulator [Candidatus Bathyarchaeota archaeon]|nr:Lrp/AsnC family transcriptional regulator [Candidatus Bathyarchaeota archaeon]